MEIFWVFFTAVPLIVFAVMETLGIITRRPYTRYLRKWLGIEPRRKGALWAWWTFASMWLLFVVWFPLHLACAWPWEGC